ncbi:MAG TPA: DMT family transporter [candidate division Zixibacteria bacterium]|nr:DMT family transporter [candidate division Zixibacteria bacterium]
MFPIALALSGSFWFAASMILINRGLLTLDYFRGLLANLAVNAAFLWIYILIFGASVQLWLPVNGVFVAVGVFVPGVARFVIFKGVERLGAAISSCLTNSGPLFALALAVAFLGERPTTTNVLGAVSIVGGIVALSWKGVSKTWRTLDLAFPLTAALLFAARDNLVRFAVVRIPDPVVGAAISATTSLGTMAAAYAIFGEKKPLPRSAAAGVACFALSGFMNFLSYVLTYTALSLERVSIISPLVNASSLFILPLSALFLRDVETLTARKIGAIGLVILGVFLISWEKL